MPRYTVQTADGPMEYGSLEQLRKAVEIGLVRATDMVNQDGFATSMPAARVVARVGMEVKSARLAIPIPSPVPSLALMSLALAALLYAELPRIAWVYPSLGHVPGMALLLERPPSPESVLTLPPWAPPWPEGMGFEHLATAVLMFAAFLRGLFAAAPQTAAFFLLLGAYFQQTGRLPLTVACGLAVVLAVVQGVRRLRKRRRAAAGEG